MPDRIRLQYERGDPGDAPTDAGTRPGQRQAGPPSLAPRQPERAWHPGRSPQASPPARALTDHVLKRQHGPRQYRVVWQAGLQGGQATMECSTCERLLPTRPSRGIAAVARWRRPLSPVPRVACGPPLPPWACRAAAPRSCWTAPQWRPPGSEPVGGGRRCRWPGRSGVRGLSCRLSRDVGFPVDCARSWPGSAKCPIERFPFPIRPPRRQRFAAGRQRGVARARRDCRGRFAPRRSATEGRATEPSSTTSPSRPSRDSSRAT